VNGPPRSAGPGARRGAARSPPARRAPSCFQPSGHQGRVGRAARAAREGGGAARPGGPSWRPRPRKARRRLGRAHRRRRGGLPLLTTWGGHRPAIHRAHRAAAGVREPPPPQGLAHPLHPPPRRGAARARDTARRQRPASRGLRPTRAGAAAQGAPYVYGVLLAAALTETRDPSPPSKRRRAGVGTSDPRAAVGGPAAPSRALGAPLGWHNSGGQCRSPAPASPF